MRENPDASADSLKSLRDFVKHVTLGIDGIKAHDDRGDTDDENGYISPDLKIVRNY